MKITEIEVIPLRVPLDMACVDELLLKGDWDLTINRKRGLRQWRSDIERR